MSGTVNHKRKYAKYPSAFGELDCRGIAEVAMKHGMEVISCRKPNFHCFNEIGIYGTSEQMKAVELEWNSYGNEPKPRNFNAYFPVNLAVPRKRWVSVMIVESRKNAISTKGGKERYRTKHGRNLTIPLGYRVLRSREMPSKDDIAWNASAQVFEPIDWGDVKSYGKPFFKKHAVLILRKATSSRTLKSL